MEERLWAKVRKTETCWLWTGALTTAGYGHIWDGTKLVYVHRLAYEPLVGPIPQGYTLDHVKANGRTSTACVKAVADEHGPAHLEPVTQAENVGRGVVAQRTHREWGHEFNEDNIYRDADGYRKCLTCRGIRAKRQNEKRRAARRARHDG